MLHTLFQIHLALFFLDIILLRYQGEYAHIGRCQVKKWYYDDGGAGILLLLRIWQGSGVLSVEKGGWGKVKNASAGNRTRVVSLEG